MKQDTEQQYTEKDIIVNICRRLNILIEEFSTEHKIEVASYYDIAFVFDDDGNVIEIDSHP